MSSKFPSEFRQSRFNQRWVLVAKDRARRPHQFPEQVAVSPNRDPFDPVNLTSDGIRDALPTVADWRVIAIDNAFPFLTPGADPDLRGRIRDGYGHHEIIIHSPDRDRDFEHFEPSQTEAVIELYVRRYRELAAQPHIKHVQIFTNRGPAAGASVRHPHSQIVALPIVPGAVQRLVETAKAYHAETGKSVADDELAEERDAADRVVGETDHFLVYCPFAPHVDYHVRILPKAGGARFEAITDEERSDLAKVINDIYRRLNGVAGIPAYNAFIRTAPVHQPDLAGFRWHIDIIPHLGTPGGLEISTGLDVVTVAPETAAATLRNDPATA